MNKIKILVAVVVLFVFGLLCQTHYQTVNKLKIENTEKEKMIAELNNDKHNLKENRKKIIDIDDKIIFDMAEMFKKLDKYCEQPELLILDGSVVMSSTERGFEKRYDLLDDMDIEYQKPTNEK